MQGGQNRNTAERVAKKVRNAGAVLAGGAAGLTVAGFTTSGVAAGSIAAGAQSIIGPIVAGSAFATLQSLGATGVIAATGGIGAVVLGVGAGLALIFNHFRRDQEEPVDGDQENDSEEVQDVVSQPV